MNSRDFCFWLQGLFELSPDTATLSADQTMLIKQHLALVFKHDIGADGKCDHEVITLPSGQKGFEFVRGRSAQISDVLIC